MAHQKKAMTRAEKDAKLARSAARTQARKALHRARNEEQHQANLAFMDTVGLTVRTVHRPGKRGVHLQSPSQARRAYERRVS